MAMQGSYVKMPKDLSKIKRRIALNMTARQLIWFGVAGVTALGFYWTSSKFLHLGKSTAALIMIFIAIPSFLMAMYERDGQPFEKYMWNFISTIFIRPKKRPYVTVNVYEILERQNKLDEEIKRIKSGDFEIEDKFARKRKEKVDIRKKAPVNAIPIEEREANRVEPEKVDTLANAQDAKKAVKSEKTNKAKKMANRDKPEKVDKKALRIQKKEARISEKYEKIEKKKKAKHDKIEKKNAAKRAKEDKIIQDKRTKENKRIAAKLNAKRGKENAAILSKREREDAILAEKRAKEDAALAEKRKKEMAVIKAAISEPGKGGKKEKAGGVDEMLNIRGVFEGETVRVQSVQPDEPVPESVVQKEDGAEEKDPLLEFIKD